MKRYLTLLLMFVPCIMYAQVQYGYVRTAGTEKEKGQPLKDVSIRAEGVSSVISDEEGNFAIALPYVGSEGDPFRIISVRKKDFELLDQDALNAQFVYSTSVPIEIVMISSEQLLAIKQEIEDTARKNATEKYERILQDLSEQLENQQITAQQYNTKISQLKEQQELFEKLILTMADYYARTDYDKLDPLNAEINRCIAAGELERADSLINTKGDVVIRAWDNINRGQDIHNIEQQLDKVKQNL